MYLQKTDIVSREDQQCLGFDVVDSGRRFTRL